MSDYESFVKELGLDTIEISDGVCNELTHDLKCKYIADFSKKFTVFSEVGIDFRFSSNVFIFSSFY